MNAFETSLKKHLVIFADQEMYFVHDTRNLELFASIPLNSSEEDIRTKLSAIDDTDISRNSLMGDVIAHLLKLKIDDRLKKGDLSVVEDIAHITSNGKAHHLLHFASVYCNFHRPDIFPIYSDQYLDFYKRYINEYKLPLDPDKLNTYDVFSKALDDLVNRLALKGKMNYLQLRKFAWLYAETVAKEGKN